MKCLAGPPEMKLPVPDGDSFVRFGDRGKVQNRPASGTFLQISGQIVKVDSLHNNDNGATFFAIEPRKERVREPLIELIPKRLRLHVNGLLWIVNDEEIAAKAGKGATD
jgi:hypothetical protein